MLVPRTYLEVIRLAEEVRHTSSETRKGLEVNVAFVGAFRRLQNDAELFCAEPQVRAFVEDLRKRVDELDSYLRAERGLGWN